MASFKDSKDREWQIALDAQAILAIRADCDSDFLLNDFDRQDNTFTRLQADPVLLCRVIYLLCSDQRTERGVSEKEFYLGVMGDAIDHATEALMKAIVSFSPRRTRETLEAFARQEELQTEAVKRAVAKVADPKLREEMLSRIDAEVDARIAQAMTQFGSAGSSPASAE